MMSTAHLNEEFHPALVEVPFACRRNVAVKPKETIFTFNVYSRACEISRRLRVKFRGY